MRPIRRTIAGLTVAGVATLALTGAGAGIASAQGAAPIADIPNLTGESTSVALDSGFTDALTSLKVEPGVLGSAKLSDGSLVFPITGGNVKVFTPGSIQGPYVQGMVMHEGSGFSLTAGETEVDIEDLVVDPGDPATVKAKVSANGAVVADSVKVFDLDGSTLQPIATDASAGTATLEGTTVRLSEEAASALNSAFKVDAIKGGTTVGVATIVVNLPGQGGTGSTGSSTGGSSTGSTGGSGAPSQMPMGGMETGGGVASMDLLLVGSGLAALAAAGVTTVTVRRRRVTEQA